MCREFLQYVLIEKERPEELNIKVNWYLQQGWELYGGITVFGNSLIQALTLDMSTLEDRGFGR